MLRLLRTDCFTDSMAELLAIRHKNETECQTIVDLYEALLAEGVDVSDYADEVQTVRELIEGGF